MCNRAVAKERHKSLSIAKKNKICQACLLCRSLPLCPTCQQCPSCCQKSSCGRPSTTFFAGLALPGFESKGGIHTERRLLTPFQDKTTPVKVTGHCQPLLRSGQKQTSEGILTDPLGSMSQTRLDCQYDKVRAVSPTGVQLCRLPFRPLSGLGQTNAGEVVHPVSKINLLLGRQTCSVR